jgi:hypothetical protein
MPDVASLAGVPVDALLLLLGVGLLAVAVALDTRRRLRR